MDVFLFGLDLDGDNDDIGNMLAIKGFLAPEDLSLKGPSVGDLVAFGIDRDDAEKIVAAIVTDTGASSAAILPSVDDLLAGGDVDDILGVSGTPSIDYESLLSDEPLLGGGNTNFNPLDFLEAKTLIEKDRLGNIVAFKEFADSMDVDMQDPSDGNTLLHWAVANNNKFICEYLIARGAAQLENSYGKTPIELAVDMVSGGDSSFMALRNFLYHAVKATLDA